MSFDEKAPLVSVITATYNRSDVLAYAIKSVLWQSLKDWELRVVGDACSDDTQQVVASFADPRIHFLNLEKNVGEQSGPNNVGFKQARGRFIAYLNHDDLWLPDHLDLAVEGLNKTGADMVYTLIDAVLGDGRNTLLCNSPAGRYDPRIHVPASCWVVRRELIDQVGPWRYCRECYNMPSQDWIFRVWKAGKKITLIPRMTVVALPSGHRPGAYAKRGDGEMHFYYERILSEPDFREREMARLTTDPETPVVSRRRWLKWRSPAKVLRACGHLARRGAVFIGRRYSLYFGLHPNTVEYFLTFYRKGGFIDNLRRARGLEPIARKRKVRNL